MSPPSSLLPPVHTPASPAWHADNGTWVNDVHSKLNPVRVGRVLQPATQEEVQEAIALAASRGEVVCVAGGRHAMGGQQFAQGALLLDTRRLSGVLDLDAERGTLEVRAGIQWPELMRFLRAAQRGRAFQWGVAQKQTGADRMSLGGAVAANVHGRGLRMRPFVDDVESLVLVDAQGRAHACSRRQNAGLFRLVCGGYGLFGIVTSLTLRLTARRKVRRVVEVIRVEELMEAFERRIAEGHLYGDFQFATDPASGDFLSRGVLATYHPVDPRTPIPAGQRRLSAAQWRHFLFLAHTDRSRAFELYAAHYRATSGQLYWSDTHQLSTYQDDYHRPLDRKLRAAHPATEVITELYVPRHRLVSLLEEVREQFRADGTELIYGTIRLIERDEESFLAWAREPYACVIFNLHTEHTAAALERSARAFRRLIDAAIRRDGSYYLTYHRHATREQVLACYARFPEFLRRKREWDPEERFQSEWYRHHRDLFAGEL